MDGEDGPEAFHDFWPETIALGALASLGCHASVRILRTNSRNDSDGLPGPTGWPGWQRRAGPLQQLRWWKRERKKMPTFPIQLANLEHGILCVRIAMPIACAACRVPRTACRPPRPLRCLRQMGGKSTGTALSMSTRFTRPVVRLHYAPEGIDIPMSICRVGVLGKPCVCFVSSIPIFIG